MTRQSLRNEVPRHVRDAFLNAVATADEIHATEKRLIEMLCEIDKKNSIFALVTNP